MQQFLTYLVVGVSTAAVYAVIGSGLVLTYTTTGVFNFAHGAAGMMAAFSYWQLTVGWGWPVVPSLVVVLLILAPAFGLLVERLILRPVQRLGEAERLVMTVALLSGLIGLSQWIWDPNTPRPLAPFFSGSKALHIGSAPVTWQQLITLIVAVAVAIGLRVLLFRSRTGAEMRATVDDRALVALAGANPLRANRVAWVLGTQLAAVGGILVAPTVALDATQLSLLIVSAYTAAIFGRLRSLPMTFVGAIVVGCTEAFLTGYLPQNPYLPGLRLAAPSLLLFLALLVFPHNRLRGRDLRLREVPVPSARGTLTLAGGIVLFGVVLATTLSGADRITYGPVFSLGIVALSFVPLAGYSGQISLCQLSVAGIGAVVWGHLGAHGSPWALLGVVAISGAVGAVIALPALRLSGVYLALGTAAFAEVLDRWLFTLPAFHLGPVRIALFDQGSVALSGPSFFGYRLTSEKQLMIGAAVVLALASAAVAWLRRSRYGRRLIAVRDSEAAYATLGGNLLRAKVMVFALSAGIAGLGGAFYGMQLRSITADQFNFVAGLPIFLVAVVGGLSWLGDGLFTGSAYVGPVNALTQVAPGLSNLAVLLPSLAGVALGRNPDGVIPALRRGFDPALRDPVVAPALVVLLALDWVLRLAGVIDGWAFAAAALVVAVAPASAAHARRDRAATAADVPVEWWGVRRAFRPEDEGVLARGIAGG